MAQLSPPLTQSRKLSRLSRGSGHLKMSVLTQKMAFSYAAAKGGVTFFHKK
jgi:hypothetical protein